MRSTSALVHEADALVRYDHNRTPDREPLMATSTEEGFRAGEPVSHKACLRGDVARLTMGRLENGVLLPGQLLE
jgi:hypothetical protein